MCESPFVMLAALSNLQGGQRSEADVDVDCAACAACVLVVALLVNLI